MQLMATVTADPRRAHALAPRRLALVEGSRAPGRRPKPGRCAASAASAASAPSAASGLAPTAIGAVFAAVVTAAVLSAGLPRVEAAASSAPQAPADPLAAVPEAAEVAPSLAESVVVRNGDTLWSIARTHRGDLPAPTVVGWLMDHNDVDPAALRPGQLLALPAATD